MIFNALVYNFLYNFLKTLYCRLMGIQNLLKFIYI